MGQICSINQLKSTDIVILSFFFSTHLIVCGFLSFVSDIKTPFPEAWHGQRYSRKCLFSSSSSVVYSNWFAIIVLSISNAIISIARIQVEYSTICGDIISGHN